MSFRSKMYSLVSSFTSLLSSPFAETSLSPPPPATCKVIRIPESGDLYLWNPESWALESVIELKESEIALTIGIRTSDSGLHSVDSRSITVLNFLTWPEAWKPNTSLVDAHNIIIKLCLHCLY